MATSKPILFDFDNQADAQRSLKKVAQLMQRAGQPVVGYDFDTKVRRLQGVASGYREATLTLASGQTITLRVKDSGDVYQVLLNGSIVPLRNQDDPVKTVGEIAKKAEANQAKFQAALARKKVDLPKGIRTAAPRMEAVLQERSNQLDAEIAERQGQVAALREELGETLDGAGMAQKVDTIDDATEELTEASTAQSGMDDETGNPEGLAPGSDALDGAGTQQALNQVGDHTAEQSKPNSVQTVMDAADDRYETLDGLKATIDLPKPADGNESAELQTSDDGSGAVLKDANGERDVAIAELITDKDQVVAEALAVAGNVADGQTLDAAGLDGAIASLQNALAVVENNYPINLAEGRAEQAALEQENAASFRTALGILGVFDAVPDLSSEARKVLLKLYERPLPDGEITSIEGRDELVEALYVIRDDEGNNALTEDGKRAAIEVMPVN